LSKKVRIVFWGQGEFREDSENREISERIQRGAERIQGEKKRGAP
jgi:hypothetical protein